MTNANAVAVLLDDRNKPARQIAAASKLACAPIESRRFPDGESYVRILEPVQGRDVVVIESLDRPNSKLMPLLFVARAARDAGARSIQLVAPYLAYLRQDARFHRGEAVTSQVVGDLLSGAYDALITVDPHLHRIGSLDQVYAVPTEVLHAADSVATWIGSNVDAPYLFGPDAESAQWVEDVARRLNCPFRIATKVRRGDRDVSVELSSSSVPDECTPVVLDDIISTGQTMVETVRLLNDANTQRTVCVGIHAVFAQGAWDRLRDLGVERVATTNTIQHATNRIDVVPLIADALRRRLTHWS